MCNGSCFYYIIGYYYNICTIKNTWSLVTVIPAYQLLSSFTISLHRVNIGITTTVLLLTIGQLRCSSWCLFKRQFIDKDCKVQSLSFLFKFSEISFFPILVFFANTAFYFRLRRKTAFDLIPPFCLGPLTHGVDSGDYEHYCKKPSHC